MRPRFSENAPAFSETMDGMPAYVPTPSTSVYAHGFPQAPGLPYDQRFPPAYGMYPAYYNGPGMYPGPSSSAEAVGHAAPMGVASITPPSSTVSNSGLGPMMTPANANEPSAVTQGTSSAGAAATTPPPSKQKSKVHRVICSGVPVYEMVVGDVGVMRRCSDGFVNVTHILKLTGMDKGPRNKILAQIVNESPLHEKIQGGYGKYQGTWVPLQRGIDFAKEHNAYHYVEPLLALDLNTQDIETVAASSPQRKKTSPQKNIPTPASHAPPAKITMARPTSPKVALSPTSGSVVSPSVAGAPRKDVRMHPQILNAVARSQAALSGNFSPQMAPPQPQPQPQLQPQPQIVPPQPGTSAADDDIGKYIPESIMMSHLTEQTPPTYPDRALHTAPADVIPPYLFPLPAPLDAFVNACISRSASLQSFPYSPLDYASARTPGNDCILHVAVWVARDMQFVDHAAFLLQAIWAELAPELKASLFSATNVIHETGLFTAARLNSPILELLISFEKEVPPSAKKIGSSETGYSEHARAFTFGHDRLFFLDTPASSQDSEFQRHFPQMASEIEGAFAAHTGAQNASAELYEALGDARARERRVDAEARQYLLENAPRALDTVVAAIESTPFIAQDLISYVSLFKHRLSPEERRSVLESRADGYPDASAQKLALARLTLSGALDALARDRTHALSESVRRLVQK